MRELETILHRILSDEYVTEVRISIKRSKREPDNGKCQNCKHFQHIKYKRNGFCYTDEQIHPNNHKCENYERAQ